MKTTTINRGDFRTPYDGDADFFNDIVIDAGLAKDYEEADNIQTIELVIESAEITEKY